MRRLLLTILPLLACCSPLAAAPAAPTPAPRVIRLGLSRHLFDSVNETDARALIRLNLVTLGQPTGFDIQLAPGVYPTPQAIARALASGEIDLIGLPADEFVQLDPALLLPTVVTSFTADKATDEYLLLVRRDSPYRRLADLAGRRINIQQSVKSPLGTLWFDLLSRRAGLGAAEEVFPVLHTDVKPSRAVLPVFFRQADAAVTTRRSFLLLAELNPGITRDLVVIAESPPTVPAVLGFRAGLPTEVVAALLRAVSHISDALIGRQAMTMFQIDRIDALPISALDSTRTLFAEHARLAASAASAAAAGTVPPQEPSR